MILVHPVAGQDADGVADDHRRAGRQVVREDVQLLHHLHPPDDVGVGRVLVLLVLDATTGQNSLAQAEGFSHEAGVTGVVLTKLDGTAKGGVAVAIAERLRLPVLFVGVGEGIDDLAPFDVDAYLEWLLAA